MPEQIIRQRSVEDSLRYFVATLTKRAADTDDIELGGIAIAFGMTVARAKDEIEGLRKRLADEERLHGDTIDDRERFHEIADKLAQAVAPEEVIGEHSSMNCPWENALDLITPKAEVDKLRAELEQAKAGPGAAELAGRLNSAEAQLRAVDQRYGPVHKALDAWRTGELDAERAMRQIAKAVGRAA